MLQTLTPAGFRPIDLDALSQAAHARRSQAVPRPAAPVQVSRAYTPVAPPAPQQQVCPLAAYRAAVDAHVRAGMRRIDAIAKVAREQPQLVDAASQAMTDATPARK